MKSRAFHGREWVEKARETLAGSINEKLSALGRDERVDHRSFTRQGIDREPGEHFGPSAAHMVERGSQHDRLEDAAEARDHPERLTEVEEQIARLEALRDVLANQADTPDLEPDTRYEGAYSGGYSREDDSRGRCLDAAEQRVNIHIAGRILAHGRTLTRGRPERDTPRPIRAR